LRRQTLARERRRGKRHDIDCSFRRISAERVLTGALWWMGATTERSTSVPRTRKQISQALGERVVQVSNPTKLAPWHCSRPVGGLLRGTPPQVTWSHFLDEVSAAGHRWFELGAFDDSPAGPGQLQDESGGHGLRLSGGTLKADLHRRSAAFDDAFATSRVVASLVGELGSEHILLLLCGVQGVRRARNAIATPDIRALPHDREGVYANQGREPKAGLGLIRFPPSSG
jgi:hypothetical protein